MATKVSASGVDFVIQNQLGHSVRAFQTACEFVSVGSREGKYSKVAANQESKKLESAFHSIVSHISSIQKTLIQEGGIKPGEEERFLLLTEMESGVRQSFARTFEVLGAVDPIIPTKTAQILGGQKAELTQIVHVYYEGKGDLFIRGENAMVRLPDQLTQAISKQVEYGRCVELSWDKGIPMTLVADNLWQVQLVGTEGLASKYKFLVSDCIFQNGNDYSFNIAQSDFHMPCFDSNIGSLIVPADVGFGNKLAIFGSGKVIVDGKTVDLSWDKGCDMKNFGSSLWTLSLSPKEAVVYKFCLVKDTGEVIFEEGADRHLIGGQELVAAPKFPKIYCQHVPMEDASNFLGVQLFGKQDEVKRRMKDEELRHRGQLVSRPLPPKQTQGKGFKDDDILRINDVLRVEEVILDGEKFYFSFTSTEKAVIIQEAPEGCTAGVSGMLILDNGKLPRADDLKNRQAASWNQIAQDIRNAGLDSITTPVASFHRDLNLLRKQIETHGPAYVRINEGNGRVGHAIIVNAISEDLSKIEIRDPWHCWEGIVKGSAFKDAWFRSLNQCEGTDHIVQVRRNQK